MKVAMIEENALRQLVLSLIIDAYPDSVSIPDLVEATYHVRDNTVSDQVALTTIIYCKLGIITWVIDYTQEKIVERLRYVYIPPTSVNYSGITMEKISTVGEKPKDE